MIQHLISDKRSAIKLAPSGRLWEHLLFGSSDSHEQIDHGGTKLGKKVGESNVESKRNSNWL